jgi:hypothetical protein
MRLPDKMLQPDKMRLPHKLRMPNMDRLPGRMWLPQRLRLSHTYNQAGLKDGAVSQDKATSKLEIHLHHRFRLLHILRHQRVVKPC